MNKKGIVYALINPAMPGYIKIGKTTRDIETRINELSASSGVPHKYVCAYSIEVNDCHTVEKKLHEDFSSYRVNNNREFFNIELQKVIEKMFEINKKTEELLNFSNCDIVNYDEYGFDKSGINKETKTKFNIDGFNKEKKSNDTGSFFNSKGYDIDGYDIYGFDKNGINKETKTKFNIDGFNKEKKSNDTGGLFNSKGYNIDGFSKTRKNQRNKNNS